MRTRAERGGQLPQELTMAEEPTFIASRQQAISQVDRSCGLGFRGLGHLLRPLTDQVRPPTDQVRPPTGQVATAAVMERDAHISQQHAKAQAAS